MFTPLRDLARQPEGKALVISAISTVAVGTVVYSILEGWSLLDSVYHAMIAATTVGYGDFRPSRAASKILSIVLAFVGIVFTGLLVALCVHAAQLAFG